MDSTALEQLTTASEEDRPRPAERRRFGLLLRRAGALLLSSGLLGSALLAARASGTQGANAPGPVRRNGTTARTFLSLEQQLQVTKDCTEFFSIGQDCSNKNLWECNADDGSQGFRCCCMHGWGDFHWTEERAPGALVSGKDKCVDLSMPFVGSGVPFKDGNLLTNGCVGGNPNKMWSVPLMGQGQIKWASHPKFCIGQKGNELGVMECYAAPQWIVQTATDKHGKPAYEKPHQIKLGNNPGLCMSLSGDAYGAPLITTGCNEYDPKQLFKLETPPEPPSYADTPPVFCIAVMMAHGYEHAMLEDQFKKKRGIFECNDYAVYSNETIKLKGDGDESIDTYAMPGSLAVKFGGQWHSALNTDVFIKFWGEVVKDARTWNNTWTIKVDPDAVFFPRRLQEVLRMRWYGGNPKGAVYLNNCHRGLHGPIEVISKQGLEVYKKRWEECKKGEPYTHKQEDFYFRRCWSLLNISKVDVYNLLFENLYACDERSDTRDGRHPCFSRQVSFHPFKTAKSWEQCWLRGNSMHWSFPMTINSEVPGRANFHHA